MAEQQTQFAADLTAGLVIEKPAGLVIASQHGNFVVWTGPAKRVYDFMARDEDGNTVRYDVKVNFTYHNDAQLEFEKDTHTPDPQSSWALNPLLHYVLYSTREGLFRLHMEKVRPHLQSLLDLQSQEAKTTKSGRARFYPVDIEELLVLGMADDWSQIFERVIGRTAKSVREEARSLRDKLTARQ